MPKAYGDKYVRRFANLIIGKNPIVKIGKVLATEYGDDVAKLGKKGAIYNLGADKPVKIKKLVDIIGGKIINLPKRPGEPNCTWANVNKIKKDTKWKPRIMFEDGINEMLNNISDWKDAPLWNKKKIFKATKLWFKYLS